MNEKNNLDTGFSLDSLGGISFLDPDFMLGEGRAIELKEAKKTTAAQLLAELLENISQGDEERVRDGLKMLKEPPGSGWLKRLILGLLNAENFNEGIADAMEEAGIMPLYMLSGAVNETGCYEAYGWMLANQERTKKCLKQLGKARYGEKTKSLKWIVEDLVRHNRTDIAAKLDLPGLLRETRVEGEGFNGSDTAHAVISSYEKMKNPEEFIDKLYSDEVVRKASNDKDMDMARSQAIQGILRNIIYTDTLQKLISLEKLLRKSPNFFRAWDNYWKGIGTWQDKSADCRIVSPPYRTAVERMGLEFEPNHDIVDYLIGVEHSVIIDALGRKGSFPDRIYEKLSQGNGNRVHLIISSLRSDQLLPTITYMMGRMGADWTDSCGRGWGHCLAIFAENTNTKIIQAFIRDPNASRLLTKPDKFGKSALDYLAHHKQFEENPEFVVRTRRNMLLKVSGNTTYTPKRVNRPSM